MWQSLVTIGPETSEIRRRKKKVTYLSKIYRPAGQLSLPGGLKKSVTDSGTCNATKTGQYQGRSVVYAVAVNCLKNKG